MGCVPEEKDGAAGEEEEKGYLQREMSLWSYLEIAVYLPGRQGSFRRTGSDRGIDCDE